MILDQSREMPEEYDPGKGTYAVVEKYLPTPIELLQQTIQNEIAEAGSEDEGFHSGQESEEMQCQNMELMEPIPLPSCPRITITETSSTDQETDTGAVSPNLETLLELPIFEEWMGAPITVDENEEDWLLDFF